MKVHIIDLILEIIYPGLKCDRLGHVEKETKFKIRKRDDEPYALWVVKDFYRIIYKCKRCGCETKPSHDRYIEGFSSCSMPSSMWDEMRENGFVRIG